MPHQVEFEPIGRRGPVGEGNTVLTAARTLGVDLVALCDGHGTCGRCKVRLLEGELTAPTAIEDARLSNAERQEGWRLACQARLLGDVRLYVPPESLTTPQRTLVEGQELPTAPEPTVDFVEIHLIPPSLEQLVADAENIRRAVLEAHGQECRQFDLAMLQQASAHLRGNGWEAQAVLRDGECIAALSTKAPHIGLAVDLGTTKVAGYLLDLDSGRTCASAGLMNPQIAYGEDVITRIDRAMRSDAEARHMQALAGQAVDQLAADLTAAIGATPADIVDAVVVGNTAMHHLLLRLPVEQLVMAPFVPAVGDALDVKARDIGLHLAAGAYVHLLPNIAGYVGADHVAMMLGTGIWQASGTVLAIDIGTNTEICLAHHGELTSVSCASGPAFEGAHITHGMRAAVGAIERLSLHEQHILCATIGGASPVGLCGSGILDALAALYQAGVLNATGKMNEHPLVRDSDGQREFVLVPADETNGRAAITLTQRDVRELQLAKGAIRTGITALLRSRQLTDEDLDEVIIAGAFGSYIQVSSAIAIGMLPALPEQMFRQVGNAAGMGSKMALISASQRRIAATVAGRARYLELASLPDFSETFTDSMYLGEYHISLQR